MSSERASPELLIYTCQPEAMQMAQNELIAIDTAFKTVSAPAPGIGCVRADNGFSAASQALSARPPVFIRHICPAQVRLQGIGRVSTEEMAAACLELARDTLDSRPFSVQARLAARQESAVRAGDINETISSVLAEHGYMLDVRHPAWVFSVLMADSETLIGLSRADQNISAWTGGNRRFARRDELISRAEFKLLEAFEAFEIGLPHGAAALDLGAAPGGWTRVLREKGLSVVAIDPAALDPALIADPLVAHEKKTAQAYLESSTQRFSVVVNDMKLDIAPSCAAMLRAADALEPGGIGIMTLKLSGHHWQRDVSRARALLEARYRVTHMRQLFNNRAEVTAALKKREDA